MREILNVMSNVMDELGLTYDYMELKKSVSYPYVIGEYFENNYSNETYCTEGEFLLTLWDRNVSNMNIISLHEEIKNKFRELRVTKNGNVILFNYANSLPEQQEDGNLKKQEIRIEVKYYERGE